MKFIFNFSLLILPVFICSKPISFGRYFHKPKKQDLPSIFPECKENKTYLLSSRNSGSHFLMYLTQFMMSQTWQTPNTKYVFFDKCQDNSKNFIRAHESDCGFLFNEANGYYFKSQKGDKLIFLLRNLSDHIYKKEHKKIITILNSPDLNKKDRLTCLILGFTQPNKCQKGPFVYEYFRNIDTYLNWKKPNRLLITYDELIFNTETALSKLSNFFKTPTDSNSQQLMKNLDKHRTLCAQLTRKWNGSSAQSNQSKLSLKTKEYKKFLKIFSEILEQHYPKYYTFLRDNT